MTDYSKWDDMAREEERAEQLEKERKRHENREKYYRDQEERKVKYMKEQEAKKASGHSHGDGSGHSHGGHSHGDSGHSQPLLEQIRRPACGCGYADVEEMKRAAEAAKLEPQISPEEKTRKKIAAVHATREHGKQLFQAGQFAEAFAVYERGVLIVSGIFDLSDKEQAEMTQLEVILDLNMAACKLKLREWKSAIEQCRMALQLDPTNVKAFFRTGQAWIGLGEYEEARTQFNKALQADSTGTTHREIQHQLAEVKRLEMLEKQQVKNYTKQLEEKMKRDQDKTMLEQKEKDGKSNETNNNHDEVEQLATALREGQLSPHQDDQAWTVDGPNQQPTATAHQP